jgi:hypothetical protein
MYLQISESNGSNVIMYDKIATAINPILWERFTQRAAPLTKVFILSSKAS